MSTLEDLNVIVVYYTNEGRSKMIRVPINGIMPNPVGAISQYWLDDKQNYYTHVGVELDNNTLIKVDIQSF